MRLLLVAYEFPPSPSPQSLRWAYLVRELDAHGHEVHVLAPELGGQTPGLPALPAGVHVHRSFAGPFRGLLAALRNRRLRRDAMDAAPGAASNDPVQAAPPTMLRPPRNWKQRVSEAIQAMATWFLFPDIRGEWSPWAAHRLRRLLVTLRPDVVISSHEPANTLELGRIARHAGFHWVADLGDPVLAAYTPARWRRRARRIEAWTCRNADLVTVTHAGAAALLRERHACTTAMEILPQGFDAALTATPDFASPFDAARVELFYSGSFYSFRRADALLHALDVDPALRLNIAAITVPATVLAAAQASPERIRLLGFLPHAQVLQLQRQADVLVNLANDDMSQIPGKFHEYLGAGRPILHIAGQNDPVAQAIEVLHRGWVCANDADALRARLQAIARAKIQGKLQEGLLLDADPVLDFSWQRIARRLDAALRAIA